MATETELQKRAQEMRRNPTEPELRLWRHLSNSQLAGFKFRRQHVVYRAQAVLDFFCPAIGLAIEIDGDTHDPIDDARRDDRLTRLGYHTLRFDNEDVMRNIDGVIAVIADRAHSVPQRWSGITAPPQPLP